MGIISDAIDALEDWCKDLFKDGIQSQFDGISDLLSDTFSQTTGSGGSGGLVNDFVTQHPSQFTGGGTGGTTIWSTIETLCNNVVVPIGGFILTVILLNELIQMVLRGNNFKDFDDSIFIKWIIKALCGVILVANTYYIASALFSFGTTVCSNGLATLFGTGDYLSSTLSINPSALSGLSLGELMTVWFISLIVHLGVLILIVAIVITLASRIIEVFMYLSIAPIPMATMMDSGEWASIGKNWIKQLLALSFQGFFIVVALGIFKTLFSNAIVALNASTDGVILQIARYISSISNSFNQVAHRVNKGGKLYDEDISDMKARLEEVWRLLVSIRSTREHTVQLLISATRTKPQTANMLLATCAYLLHLEHQNSLGTSGRQSAQDEAEASAST